MYATHVRTELITPNIVTFWLEPERRLRYVAGQYLDVHVPHAAPDKRGTIRTMTLSSSPSEPLVGITTKRQPAESTFKKALHSLQPGDRVTFLTDPMGDFILPKNADIPLLFVVGGVGVTPVRSMCQWLSHKKLQRNAELLYIAKKPDDMPYLDFFTNLPWLRTTQVYTQLAPPGFTPQARPDTEEIVALANSSPHTLIYLSGPQPMMEGYWSELQKHGVPREQLVLDYFTGYNEL